jgi:hypothetical protein
MIGVKSFENFMSHQDDTDRIDALFAAARENNGGLVTIPPGDYHLTGGRAIRLPSHTTVTAYGARFHLPQTLGDRAHFNLFEGTDIVDFSWLGGHFSGQCFDHRRGDNTWEPNACTRCIVISTTAGGKTANLTFRDIASFRIAGALVTVLGVPQAGSESEVSTYAENVTLEACTFLESGKFMWDYGMLWQIMVWPDEYSPAEQAMAKRYFRNDLVREGVRMEDGDDRVFLENATTPIPVSAAGTPHHSVCFYGGDLPRNIVRGLQYFVVESTPEFIRVSEEFQGAAVRFDGASGKGVSLMHNLFATFMALYAPTGQGPGKGCFDLVCCRNVRVSGCKISALGDTMHIMRSRDIVFAQNHIIGSRMGAFFLAEHCKNSTITGNLIDGSNGSRVMSVERSNEDVTIVGNTFRNGGRGSWINQPKNLILQGNIFTDNTTKGRPGPWTGRRTYRTGDWESYPEIYFSVWEKDAAYGPVLMRDNIFTTGPEAKAAVQFERGARDVIVEGNLFRGTSGAILVDEPNPGVSVGNNPGHTLHRVQPGARFVND